VRLCALAVVDKRVSFRQLQSAGRAYLGSYIRLSGLGHGDESESEDVMPAAAGQRPRHPRLTPLPPGFLMAQLDLFSKVHESHTKPAC
jgi:hypothetical protein